jgi:hypothetical protein
MHDDDINSAFELCDPRQIAEMPIRFLTLADIITHLDGRYDGILVSAIDHGDEIPMLTALWGNSELRQKMLDHVRQFDEANPADAEDGEYEG